MADSDLLLSAAFGLEDGAHPPSRSSLTEAAQRIRDAVQDMPTLRPLFAGPGIVLELTRIFRTPLSSILVAAWNKREEIRRYGDVERYPAHETHEVWLQEHDVQETIKPTVEVRFAGMSLPKLVFQATLTARLHGAILVIRDGRITHVKLGEITTTGDLSLGNAHLVSHEIHEWSLPGMLKLGEGVKVGLSPAGTELRTPPLN